MTIPFAAFGAWTLVLLYAWLLSGIVCSYLANRKGYGERPGLATGLLLSVIGAIIWLLWPPRADSRWKLQGPLPFGPGGSGETVAEARARGVGEDHTS
jgi:hypothetical protein